MFASKSDNKEVVKNSVLEVQRFILKAAQAVIILKFMSLADFGAYSMVNIWSIAVMPVFSFGFGIGVQYFMAKDGYETSEIFSTLLVVGIAISLSCHLFLFALLRLNVLSFTNFDFFSQVDLALIAVYSTLRLINMFFDLSLKGSGEFQIFRVSSLVRVYLLTISISLTGLLASLDIQMLLLFLMASEIAKLFYTVLKVRVKLSSFNFSFVRSSVSYGIKAWFGTLSQVANNKIDQIFASMFLGLESLGTYTFVLSLMQFMNFVPSAIAPVLLRNIIKSSESTGVANLARAHRITFAVTLLGLVGYLLILYPVFENWFEEISGREFILISSIIGPGILFYSTTRRLITKYISGIGRPEISSLTQVYGSLTTVLLLMLCTVIGVSIVNFAIANSLGFIVSVGVALYYFKIFTRESIYRLFDFAVLRSDIQAMIRGNFRDID